MKKTIFKAYDQMIAGSELVNASGIKLVFNILLMLFSATYINIYPVNSIVVSAKETQWKMNIPNRSRVGSTFLINS